MAQQNERDQRVLESPEYHRTPHHVQIARLGASVPPVPPLVFTLPPDVPPPAPVYSHLPAHLAQQYAALPPLYPRRQASVAPAPALQLAPPFVPAPAPAPVTRYQHLPPHLAQQLAALPPLIQHGRGRGRGRGNNPTAPAPAPAPAPARLTYAQIVARYDALQPVCFILLLYLKFVLLIIHFLGLSTTTTSIPSTSCSFAIQRTRCSACSSSSTSSSTMDKFTCCYGRSSKT